MSVIYSRRELSDVAQASKVSSSLNYRQTIVSTSNITTTDHETVMITILPQDDM